MTEFLNNDYLNAAQPLRLRSGENHACEEEAARLLAISREGVTALSEKRDFLTRDQLRVRAQREVLNSNGFSDESLMSGLFRREYNPLAGRRPTKLRHDE